MGKTNRAAAPASVAQRIYVGPESVALSSKQRKTVRQIDEGMAKAAKLQESAVVARDQADSAASKGDRRKARAHARRAAAEAAEARRARAESMARERALVAQIIGTVELRALLAHLSDARASGMVVGQQATSSRRPAKRPAIRDGLASLFTSAAITGPMYLAGAKYRRIYEACAHGLPSSLTKEVFGGPVRQETIKAMMAQERLHIEACVHAAAEAAEIDPERTIKMLHAVAGSGICLDALGSGGNTKKANKLALRVALVAVGVILAVPGA